MILGQLRIGERQMTSAALPEYICNCHNNQNIFGILYFFNNQNIFVFLYICICSILATKIEIESYQPQL